MRFLTVPVRIRVPATSANLGPGFDALGLALALYDDVTAEVTLSDGVRVSMRGHGVDELPRDERHLIASTMRATFAALAVSPPGFKIFCDNRIPHARGLGSSSAAIIAGVLAARALVRDGAERMDDAAVLRLAAHLEGHPDNVAPCQLGGLTIAWVGSEPGQARAVRLAVAPGVTPMLLVPPHRGLTSPARAALPSAVPHGDAAFNAGRAALLVHALTVDPSLLFDATADRLHQSYRAAMMPDTAALVAALRAEGVPAVVSGAGPTVLALLPEPDGAGARVCRELGPDRWSVMSLSIAQEGAHSTVLEHAGADPVAAGMLS